MKRDIRVIISGGGTGGHLFPAISIANAIKRIEPAAEILFVGAEGRMEMQKVPEAGYRIEGLPVAGLVRGLSIRNIQVLVRLVKSIQRAKIILKEFIPDVAVGVGGYASGPVLKQAQRMKIPTLIQEQNSYAGVTNRFLAARAAKICVAYDGMEKYFPADRILMTGNPVRHTFDNLDSLRDEALRFFSLDNGKPVILVLGGSLGAGTINNSIGGGISRVDASGVQMIWQTGSHYYDRMKETVDAAGTSGIRVMGFINRMDLAYAAADIIISRAGAGTISELQLVGKPVILIPSPNVAEDHQTHNAMALVDTEAAIMVRDSEAPARLTGEALRLIADATLREKLSVNIKKMALRNADEIIAREVLKLIVK